jgi:intraflagellar transport protein 46
MPGIESLMEAWADGVPAGSEAIGNEMEQLAKRVVEWDVQAANAFPMPLEDYVKVACAIMDIPVWESTASDRDPKQTRALIDSLHLLFSVYAEFKNSQHFSKLTSK